MKLFRNGSKQFKLLVPSKARSGYVCSRLFYHFLPPGVRSAITAQFGKAWRFFCPVCEDPVRKFAPLADFYAQELAEHGSDLRLADFETCNYQCYQCAHCGATDRDRLYALYLADRLPAADKQQSAYSLLDIAPSRPLSSHIRRKYTAIRYRTADLFQKNVDDQVDITSMRCYADGTFDAFICSHVLEHVEDDRKGMAELWRVLKPGGWGIAMVPINVTLSETREVPLRSSVSERWKHFGQGDHVRLYSKAGFVQRLREAGFAVLELGRDYFGVENLTRCGLSVCSMLYVVQKADQPSLAARAGR